jgi:GNAT superfamily N-acetyltransferase
MSVVVERAEDASGFRALRELLSEYERELPADLRHGSVPRLEEVERAYAAGNAAFLARSDRTYSGCVAVTMLDPQTAILQRLYVRPAYRGRGAARALAMAAIGFARDSGCNRIVLDTEAERLSAAYALYRSIGFRECDPYGAVDYRCPTFMELRLDRATSG